MERSIRVAFQVPHSARTISLLLWVLTKINLLYLKTHPATPPLYRSQVRYQREPPGREEWRAIPQVLRDGHGDCEDLACWRAAELLAQGIGAEAFVTYREKVVDGRVKRLYHVRVRFRRPNGSMTTEDPSRRLGMGIADLDLRGEPVDEN